MVSRHPRVRATMRYLALLYGLVRLVGLSAAEALGAR
jgi:hypothetical protein